MNDDQARIFDALEFSAYKHRYQKRKGANGIPYINHPIEVANMLVQKVNDRNTNMIIAALLHDVLEDTDTNPAELINRFGDTIYSIVNEVTDDMNLAYSLRKQLQIRHAADLTYPARCIKIADKACNIRDVLRTRFLWPDKRKIEYILWAIQVVNEIRDTDENLVAFFDAIVRDASDRLDYDFSLTNS
jgi:guanosine-3',5'-bis(diphosphate) 3'-pyrophosphohydrolase